MKACVLEDIVVYVALRRDTYEPTLILYWCEKAIRASHRLSVCTICMRNFWLLATIPARTGLSSELAVHDVQYM